MEIAEDSEGERDSACMGCPRRMVPVSFETTVTRMDGAIPVKLVVKNHWSVWVSECLYRRCYTLRPCNLLVMLEW